MPLSYIRKALRIYFFPLMRNSMLLYYSLKLSSSESVIFYSFILTTALMLENALQNALIKANPYLFIYLLYVFISLVYTKTVDTVLRAL